MRLVDAAERLALLLGPILFQHLPPPQIWDLADFLEVDVRCHMSQCILIAIVHYIIILHAQHHVPLVPVISLSG